MSETPEQRFKVGDVLLIEKSRYPDLMPGIGRVVEATLKSTAMDSTSDARAWLYTLEVRQPDGRISRQAHWDNPEWLYPLNDKARASVIAFAENLLASLNYL